jgi:hypothetical protein
MRAGPQLLGETTDLLVSNSHPERVGIHVQREDAPIELV